MDEEDDRARELRQQRELVHGSGAPRTLGRHLPRAMAPPHHPPPPRRWNDVSRGERGAWVAAYLAALALVALVLFTAWRAAGGVVAALAAGLLVLCAALVLVLRRRSDQSAHS